MDLSVLRKKSALAFGGLLALTVCAGSMQASSLLTPTAVANAVPIPVAVSCNTLNGPPSVATSVTIKVFPLLTGTNTVTVGVVQTPGIKVTLPAITTLSLAGGAGTVANGTGIVLTVNSTAGCSNANGNTANTLVSGANPPITVVLTAQQNAGTAVADNPLTVTDTIVSTTSALVAASVTVTCGYSGGVWVPGVPQMVSVSSAANQGTPFTVTTGSLPSWLVLGPAAPSGTAGTTAVNFTVQAVSNCHGDTSGSATTFLLPLASSPAPAVNVTITLKIIAALTPLTVTPVPASPTISMSYTKLSGIATTTTVNVLSSISTPAASTFYSVINFPIWLTVNNATGFIPYTTGKNLIFSTTTATDSLAPGTYTATVFIQVANYPDEPVTITLLVANKAPTLSITSANPMPVLYTLEGPTPVSTITIASSDSPIPYTISFGGLLAPALASGLNEQLTGIAYSFGTNIAITYNPLLFETSAPGTVISGTVTFTWGSPATSSTPATTTVLTINLTVGSPGATLSSIYPASLPTAAPGTVFYVTLTGSGFVGGTDPTLATKVGTVTGSNPSTVNQDPNFHLTWINPSNMTLQITVPALVSGGNGDGNLPFLVGGAGGPVYLGVVNGSNTTPTGTATLSIGANPIVYGATSSSSFTEVSGGALPSFAPYDMISIFGSNFCSSTDAAIPGNGGCANTTVLAGKPDSVYGVFPFSLTPDQYITPTPPLAALWRNLTVMFYPHGTLSGGTLAPLLFATNGQINAIVPGVLTAAPTEYDIVVGFGPTGAIATSASFPVNIQATDPGVFTIGSDGQGPAAALNLSYSLINSANPAAMRSGATNSDFIQLYVTGLGVPLAGAAVYTSSTDVCIGALNVTNNGYLTALNAETSPAGTFTAIDGAVLNYSLFTGDLPPCVLASGVGVTIGGVATATPTFAGFVDGTVAGLYQIDVQLPRTDVLLKPNFPSLTGDVNPMVVPMQLPVFVTINSVTSQAGVYLNVAPRLKVLAPTNLSLEQLQSWTTGNAVVASLGTSTITYALTAGVLPAGLTLIDTSGLITGTVAANTAGSYVVTVTATDSAAIPITGSVTFTVSVGGGLYVSYSGTPNLTNVFGTAGVSLPDITAIGGSGAGYTYALTSSTLASPPAGISLTSGSNGQLVVSGAAEGGLYLLSVTASDNSTPPITGLDTFTYTVALDMAYVVTTATPPAAGTTAVGTFTTTGNTTTPVHYTSSNPAFTIVDGTGVVSITGLSDGAASATITATDTGTAPGAETGTHATQTFLVSITVTG